MGSSSASNLLLGLTPLALPHNKLHFPTGCSSFGAAPTRAMSTGFVPLLSRVSASATTAASREFALHSDGCMQRPGHCCSSTRVADSLRPCYQFSVWRPGRPDNQSWTHALPSLETDAISGHQISWSVAQCGSACTILQARFLPA